MRIYLYRRFSDELNVLSCFTATGSVAPDSLSQHSATGSPSNTLNGADSFSDLAVATLNCDSNHTSPRGAKPGDATIAVENTDRDTPEGSQLGRVK